MEGGHRTSEEAYRYDDTVELGLPHCTGWTRFDEYPTKLYRPRPVFAGQSVVPLRKPNISGCTKYKTRTTNRVPIRRIV